MQLFHKDTRDRPYSNLKEAENFVERFLDDAKRFQTDADTLRFASDMASLDGLYIELGVYKGRTINFISALNPTKIIYGFDSFKGLPEDWERTDKHFPKESFALEKNEQPYLNPNIVINIDLFHQSLPEFCQNHMSKDSQISFLHVDCDLYSSTRDALKHLGPFLRRNSVVIFDEFYNYPGSENHEFKAFIEFANKSGTKFECIAFNEMHEQVVVKIL